MSSCPHLVTSFKLKNRLWFLPLLFLFLLQLRFFWCISCVLHCLGWPSWSNDCRLILSAHFVCSLVINICVHTCTQGAYCVHITHTHTHFLLSSQHHQHCNIIPLGSEAAHNVILRTNMHHSLACFSRHLELCTMPLNAWPFGWFAPICSHYLFSVFLVNAFTFETLAVCETFLHSARQGSRILVTLFLFTATCASSHGCIAKSVREEEHNVVKAASSPIFTFYIPGSLKGFSSLFPSPVLFSFLFAWNTCSTKCLAVQICHLLSATNTLHIWKANAFV